MTVKERLILFTKSQKISNSEFCRTIGVSNAFISSMRKSLQPDKIESIALNYPALNIDWLLTGEGKMLKSNSIELNRIEMESQTLINELRDRVLSLEKQLDEKQKFCQFLMKQNEDLQQLVTASPEIKKKEAS